MDKVMFTTEAEVKTLLRINDSFAASDFETELVLQSIELATEQLRAYTRRDWLYGNYTDFVPTRDINAAKQNGRDHITFYLRERPVDTSKPIDIRFGSGNWANISPSNIDYDIDEETGRLTFYPVRMSAISRRVRIDYWAGYAEDPDTAGYYEVSRDLAQAATIQAAYHTQMSLNRTSNSKRTENKTGITSHRITKSGLVQDAVSLAMKHVRNFTR